MSSVTNCVEAKHRMHEMNMDERSTEEGSRWMPPSALDCQIQAPLRLSLCSQHLRGADKVLPPSRLSSICLLGTVLGAKECGFIWVLVETFRTERGSWMYTVAAVFSHLFLHVGVLFGSHGLGVSWSFAKLQYLQCMLLYI